MASLVADYSDSSDEGEEIHTTRNHSAQHDLPKVEIKEEPLEDDPPAKRTNFFSSLGLPGDEEDSDTSKVKPELPESSSEACHLPNPLSKPQGLPNPLSKPQGLPNPLSKPNPLSEPQRLPSMREATSSKEGTFVFANPFDEAEQVKKSILEHHVRLTEARPQKPANKAKCWKFKKGQCSMGKNCRFFHDLESVSPQDEAVGQSEEYKRPAYHPSVMRHSQYSHYNPEPVDDDSYMATTKRKRRYGVNDHLLPPKKAFNALMEERLKERPWTVGQRSQQH